MLSEMLRKIYNDIIVLIAIILLRLCGKSPIGGLNLFVALGRAKQIWLRQIACTSSGNGPLFFNPNPALKQAYSSSEANSEKQSNRASPFAHYPGEAVIKSWFSPFRPMAFLLWDSGK